MYSVYVGIGEHAKMLAAISGSSVWFAHISTHCGSPNHIFVCPFLMVPANSVVSYKVGVTKL